MNNDGILMTKEGFEQVRAELDHLKGVHRKEVAERIRESKQFGEFLENSEYEEAKAEQAYVEGRILELQHILQNAVVVEGPQEKGDKIGLGSVVKLVNESTGKEVEYRIVGPVEADPTNHRISYQSPVGQALLDHGTGDIVQVATPNGTNRYRVLSVTN